MSTRICPKGHKYDKSSDCPSCPICEREKVPESAFHALLGAPARRALEREKITSLEKLAACSESELLQLHGFGPASLPVLREALKEAGLRFKKNE